MTSHHLVLVAATAVTFVAAIFDWRKGEIPNWLTYGALVLAPIGHMARALRGGAAMDIAAREGGFSIGGAIVCAIVPLMLYRQGAIGGGDIKLMAAIGAMLQTLLGIEAEMYGIVSAVLLAPAQLAYQGKLLSSIQNTFKIGLNFFLPKDKRSAVNESALTWFRLGPALFLGVAFTAYLRW